MASAPVTPQPCAPAPVDIDDMQALVRRAFGHLPFARYLLLGIADPAAARAWLATLADEVATAGKGQDDLPGPCVNLALTGAGLARLGLAAADSPTLPVALREGMVTEHRSRILGDSGTSDPSKWRWGGPHNPGIDLVLMIFADSEAGLDQACLDRRQALEQGGALSVIGEPIDGQLIGGGGREHFGFADGISQPTLKGVSYGRRSVQPPTGPEPSKWAEVEPGEVILGYCDNYMKPSAGPMVSAASDPTGLLPPWGPDGRHHLGQNGSYLVFRQLAQDVDAFQRFLQSAELPAASDGSPSVPGLLGAKIVGRWPNGAPLVHTVTGEEGPPFDANDFGYHELDQDGLRCPAGAHIRRSNPRDSSADDPGRRLISTKNHRIMRRGRPYGLPIEDPPTAPGEEAAAERGLLFICLNADIERQFEFVQHTWLNNRYFAGLNDEVDPLVGSPPDSGGTYTLPADPVRRRVTGIPNFVTVKGGEYFFLPGIRALRYLAGLQTPTPGR